MKKQNSMKTLTCLLAFFAAALLLFAANAEAADVAINSTNFPNSGFRTFVKNKFDKDHNGKLSAAEIKAVKKIDCGAQGFGNLKGIERFTELEYLDCYANDLAELDLSRNTKLKVLMCSDNLLTTLDLSHNPLLEELECGSNDLTGLDLSNNAALCRIRCNENQFTVLDLHLCPKLVQTVTKPDEKFTYFGFVQYVYRDLSYEEGEDGSDEGVECIVKCDKDVELICGRPSITAQPSGKTVAAGEKVTFKVKARGGGLSYQWQYRKPGGSWVNVASASGKKASYTFTAAARHYHYQYRCKVTNAAGKRFSAAVTLTVETKPVITSPAKAVTRTVKKGAAVKLTVKAYAAESYQWYYRTSSKGNWKKVTVTSGKKAAYSFTATLAKKGWQYRCKVTNPYGYVYSKVFTLKVTS